MVVGGGMVARRKVASLLDYGARVTVVSPELCPELEEIAARREIELFRRPFDSGDLRGATLAIAATNNETVNRAVLEAGRAAGVWVNVVDVPDVCDFYVPASIRRGPIEIAIGTSGQCPALAKRLRIELEKVVGPEYEAYAELCGRLRVELQAHVPEAERRVAAEKEFLDSPARALLAEGKAEEAERIRTSDSISRSSRRSAIRCRIARWIRFRSWASSRKNSTTLCWQTR